MKYLFLLCLLFLGCRCQDTFERDISRETVSIIAPSDGAQTTTGLITFLWEEVDGADRYRLTVVTPSFVGASQVIADTLVAGCAFQTGLAPGHYQWSLTPCNFAYTGPSVTYTLHIVEKESVDEAGDSLESSEQASSFRSPQFV